MRPSFFARRASEDDEGFTFIAGARIQPLEPLRSVLPSPYAYDPPALRPYQQDAVHTLIQALEAGRPMVLDASETGLGKTWTALAVVKHLGWKFGIACPSNIVTKWTDTAMDEPFGLLPEFAISFDKLRNGKQPCCTRVERIVRRKKRVSFQWNLTERTVLIFDEVHACAGADSLNSKLLLAAIEHPLAIVIGLSATCANDPLGMKILGQGLELHDGAGWWKWCLRMGCIPGPFGGLLFDTGMSGQRAPTAKQARAQQKLREIHEHIFPHRGCRLRKDELGERLADNTIMAECVDVDWKDPRIADLLALVDKAEEEDEDKAAEKDSAVSALVINTRDRQRAEILKIPELVARAKQLMNEGNSVIISATYSTTIMRLDELLNFPKAKIVGGLGAKIKDEVAKFQLNNVRLCLVQSDAGSASIDLDDTRGSFPRCVLVSPTYSARQLIQMLGRAHRGPTTKSPVMQWVLFAAGTVEERVCRLVQRKLNNLAMLNDGDMAGVTRVA